jgi:hypothetical protein
VVYPAIAGLNEGKKGREKAFLPCPRIQIVTEAVSTKTLSNLSSQFAASMTDRRFDFHKRSQLFIRTHNKALSVVAVRVSNAL